jgi:hypothetical protein
MKLFWLSKLRKKRKKKKERRKKRKKETKKKKKIRREIEGSVRRVKNMERSMKW